MPADRDCPPMMASPSPAFASALSDSEPSLSTGTSWSFFDCATLRQAPPPNTKGVRGNRVLPGLVRSLSSPELFALLTILLLRRIFDAHHKLTADMICRFRRPERRRPRDHDTESTGPANPVDEFQADVPTLLPTSPLSIAHL